MMTLKYTARLKQCYIASILFQVVSALKLKDRFAASVCTLGTWSAPAWDPFVERLDTSERRWIIAAKPVGTSAEDISLFSMATSLLSIKASTLRQPSASKAGVICWLRLKPVTIRAAKLIIF